MDLDPPNHILYTLLLGIANLQVLLSSYHYISKGKNETCAITQNQFFKLLLRQSKLWPKCIYILKDYELHSTIRLFIYK